MNKIIISIPILFLCLTPMISIAGEISRVTIRSEKFDVISILEDAKAIQAFEVLWKTKTKFPSPVETKLSHKIDIESKGRSERWLYSPEGFVRVLSKSKVPTYRISSVDEFNRLIGLHNKSPKRDEAKTRRAP